MNKIKRNELLTALYNANHETPNAEIIKLVTDAELTKFAAIQVLHLWECGERDTYENLIDIVTLEGHKKEDAEYGLMELDTNGITVIDMEYRILQQPDSMKSYTEADIKTRFTIDDIEAMAKGILKTIESIDTLHDANVAISEAETAAADILLKTRYDVHAARKVISDRYGNNRKKARETIARHRKA